MKPCVHALLYVHVCVLKHVCMPFSIILARRLFGDCCCMCVRSPSLHLQACSTYEHTSNVLRGTVESLRGSHCYQVSLTHRGVISHAWQKANETQDLSSEAIHHLTRHINTGVSLLPTPSPPPPSPPPQPHAIPSYAPLRT